MGCYDAVDVPCPECTSLIEFQSKARNCNLEVFPADKVPASIAEDLDGTSEKCEDCGYVATLRIASTVLTVIMEVT